MIDTCKTVLVRFLDGNNKNNTYPYACYDEVANDDMIVVHTGHHGYTLAQIADAEPKNPGKVQFGREVVAKVDFSAYTARKDRLARAEKLKRDMDSKVQHLKQMALYDMLAKKDPAMQALLSEYRELIGENPVVLPEPDDMAILDDNAGPATDTTVYED